MGPEAVIAIAGSQRAWAAELVSFLTDFGGARLKGTVLTAREALEPGYEVLIIDDITSYLSPRVVERVREIGGKVVGIYDPEAGERGRERLNELGVDAVLPASADPEVILETITALGPGRPERVRAPAFGSIEEAPSASITVIAGGDLAGDIAIALAGVLQASKRSTLLVEADTVTPMLAQRLSMPIVPNLLTALDAHVQLRGSIQDSFLAGPYGITLLTGIPEASEWRTVRADEVMDLVGATAEWFDEVILKVSPWVEDLSGLGGPRGEVRSESVGGRAGYRSGLRSRPHPDRTVEVAVLDRRRTPRDLRSDPHRLRRSCHHLLPARGTER